MGAESLTMLLSICLGISVIILFVLITIFLILYIRNKKQKDEKKKENDIQLREEKLPSNVIMTKMYTTENIKNFMDFTEIKDNMILQKDGKRLVMVIKCKGVNYDLMSSAERAGVEQGFSQFLNALTKPVQLHIQSRKVNLEESIENYKKRLYNIESSYQKARQRYEDAQKRGNISPKRFKDIKLDYVRQKNLYEYTKDVINNTERLSLNQHILTKNYYIAISHYLDNSENLFQEDEMMEMAFSELYTNAQAILRTLGACGITGKVLDSLELAELLYVAFNRDTSEIYGVDKAIKSGYDALYTTAPDVLNKRIEELDNLIDEKAFELANDTVNKVAAKNAKEKEIEEKEKNMEELIKEMAKSMIEESTAYLPKDIIEESIKEIEKIEKNTEKNKETKKKRTKKGA